MRTAQKVKTMPLRQKPGTTQQAKGLTGDVIGAIRDLLNALEEMERGEEEAALIYIGEAKGKLPGKRMDPGGGNES